MDWQVTTYNRPLTMRPGYVTQESHRPMYVAYVHATSRSLSTQLFLMCPEILWKISLVISAVAKLTAVTSEDTTGHCFP